MSSLAFSVGFIAPSVYLSLLFYENYGYSQKHCRVFRTASYVAAGCMILLSLLFRLSVEFAVLSCLDLLVCCYIGRLCFRDKEVLSDNEPPVLGWINISVHICFVILLLCVGFFRRILFDVLFGQGSYSIVYCAMWITVIVATTIMDVKSILRSKMKITNEVQNAKKHTNDDEKTVEQKRQEIMSILSYYANGEYTTSTFCDVFSSMYYYENSACSCFTGTERKILDELAEVTTRYSPYKSDLATGAFFNDADVASKFNEAWSVIGSGL